MTRVATRPLNPEATASANAAAKTAYPSPPSPGDAEYPSFQKVWMDAYVASGGRYSEQTPENQQTEIAEAKAASQGSMQTHGALQLCTPGGPAFVPPPTACSCTLTDLTVRCSHDNRTARDDLLQIVVDALAVGDEIRITPSASGDCAAKLVIRTRSFDGSDPTESKGPAEITRETRAPAALQPSQFGWWKARPSVATIETTTCGGNPQLTRVERFPSGESKVTLNLSNLIEGFAKGFSKLPVDLRLFTQRGTPRKRRRNNEAKDEDFTLEGLKKRFNNTATSSGPKDAEFIFRVASAWKEEKSSHLAYCEVAALIAADPLMEWKCSILIYGIPVPSKIRKYIDIAAGIYLNINGKIVAGAQISVKRYPLPVDEWKWNNVQGRLSGEVKFELALELCVLSPKVLQAKGGGAVSAEGAGAFRNDFDSKVWLDYQVAIGKLTAGVTFKTLWGLVEYEREWQIFEGWTRDDTTEVLDFNR